MENVNGITTRCVSIPPLPSLGTPPPTHCPATPIAFSPHRPCHRCLARLASLRVHPTKSLYHASPPPLDPLDPPLPPPPLARKLKHCTEHIQSAMYIYISTTKYRVSIIIIVVVHTRAKLEKAIHARLTRATRKQNQMMRKCSTSTNRRF